MGRTIWRSPPWHIRRTGFPEAWRLLRLRRSAATPVRDRPAGQRRGPDSTPTCGTCSGPGINLLSPGEPPHDEHGHGTHVAGILAVASGAVGGQRPIWPPPLRIRPVKIFDRQGLRAHPRHRRWAASWCLEQGCEIVNLSFGTDRRGQRPSGRRPSGHGAARHSPGGRGGQRRPGRRGGHAGHVPRGACGGRHQPARPAGPVLQPRARGRPGGPGRRPLLAGRRAAGSAI